MSSKKMSVILFCPTASGKSRLAVEKAKKINGVIINCDSVQLYSQMEIISAAPSAEDMRLAEHKLYNVFPPDQHIDVKLWLGLAKEAVDEALDQGKNPIIVGGTGLYIKAMLEGISHIPDIPEPQKLEARKLFNELGAGQFHNLLKDKDPEAAAKLHPNDKVRVVRAYEVVEYTGRTIGYWQSKPINNPFATYDFEVKYICPDKDILHQNIDARFRQMLKNGVIDEIRRLRELYSLEEIKPKPCGLKQLWNYLDHKITLKEATELALVSTKQYAKRQITWFRHQLASN